MSRGYRSGFLLWLFLLGYFGRFRATAFSFEARPISPHFSTGTCSALRESSNDDDALQQPDYKTEETLLKVNLAVLPTSSLDEAREAVAKYCQSFPFAAVLPVQPLQYLPTPDGVEIKFLRKKTGLKSGIDGGIRFFVNDSPEETAVGLQVTAKRNAVGQAIQKIMSEKLVVTAYVAGITGEEGDKYGRPPLDHVRVTSLYHKWM
jgi:hypothetical protein